MLEEYKRLLERYYEIISQPNWYADLTFANRNGVVSLPPLVYEMEKLWGKMSKLDRDQALHYTQELYTKRLLKNGTNLPSNPVQ